MNLSTEQARRQFVTSMFHDMGLDGFVADRGYVARYDRFISGELSLDEADAEAAEWLAAGNPMGIVTEPVEACAAYA